MVSGTVKIGHGCVFPPLDPPLSPPAGQDLVSFSTLTIHDTDVAWEVLSLREAPCPFTFAPEWLELCAFPGFSFLPSHLIPSNGLFPLQVLSYTALFSSFSPPTPQPSSLLVSQSHQLPAAIVYSRSYKDLERGYLAALRPVFTFTLEPMSIPAFSRVLLAHPSQLDDWLFDARPEALFASLLACFDEIMFVKLEHSDLCVVRELTVAPEQKPI